MELLVDASALMLGNARPCIGHADAEVAVDRLCSYAHFARISKLDGIAHEVEEHMGEALVVFRASEWNNPWWSAKTESRNAATLSPLVHRPGLAKQRASPPRNEPEYPKE